MDIPSDIKAAREGSGDIVKTAVWAVWFFGSLILAVYAIRRYLLLDDRVYLVLLVAVPVFFCCYVLGAAAKGTKSLSGVDERQR